jgi:ComF family protein
MNIFDQIVALFVPFDCVACGTEGLLLCAKCRLELPTASLRCFLCLRPSPEARTCPNCKATSDVYSVRAATNYQGIAKQLVRKLKFSGARAASKEMGQLFPLPARGTQAIVMHVPTATSRIRSRGYDQAALLAVAYARHARLPFVPCLVRRGQQHQVGASRAQRMAQLQSAFSVTKQRKVKGAHVIIVDDVVTTGATLQAAASALTAAGASRVEAVVFAQA